MSCISVPLVAFGIPQSSLAKTLFQFQNICIQGCTIGFSALFPFPKNPWRIDLARFDFYVVCLVGGRRRTEWAELGVCGGWVGGMEGGREKGRRNERRKWRQIPCRTPFLWPPKWRHIFRRQHVVLMREKQHICSFAHLCRYLFGCPEIVSATLSVD